jgi:hypothetical protein
VAAYIVFEEKKKTTKNQVQINQVNKKIKEKKPQNQSIEISRPSSILQEIQQLQDTLVRIVLIRIKTFSRRISKNTLT